VDRLYNKLKSYSEEDYYPMHMPGHKRNTELMQMGNPYAIDITEIEGFDNLHQAEGILKQLAMRISRLYKAKKSFPLINGSTAGILAGISAATSKGDKVLLARNSHKSVYHATILRSLKPFYCYPQQREEMRVNGGILAENIEDALITNKDIKLVVVTSPTYEGVVSDIRAIAEVVHRHKALLLVDEAHGAHFGFHEKFPQSAICLGADLVIQSFHKTLPAFTQTAVLHSNRMELNHKIEQYLAIYQSSSPSYLLMAGIDRLVNLLEENAKELFIDYDKKLEEFKHRLEPLKHLTLIDRRIIGQDGIYDLDPSKITISVQNTQLTGHQLQELLREKYHIVMEMEASDYVLGMTSICDTNEGFERLAKALLAIDQEEASVHGKRESNVQQEKRPIHAIQAMSPSEAWEQETEQITLPRSIGRISATFVSLFPPGSPLIVPGELIEEGILEYIRNMKQVGITVTGLAGEQKDEIEVVIQGE
jgi:arginine/lysine/ornithine decarboxylase